MAPLAATDLTTTDLFAAVKERVSIHEMLDYHGLKYRGRSIQCPNFGEHKHGDRSRSAWISSTGRTRHCYGCGQGGSVVDILTLVRGLYPQDAVRALCDYAGIGVIDRFGPHLARARLQAQPAPSRVAPKPEPPPPLAGPEVHSFLRWSQQLLLKSDHARHYLESRGIPLAVARAAGLGYAPCGTWPHRRGADQPRIVAPLTTPGGILLTLYGRATVPCIKNLHHDLLPGTKGIYHACSLHDDGCILVEGLFDALSCLAAGHPAAAINGLSVREAWWAQMPSSRFILAADADTAGQQRSAVLTKAAKKAGKPIHCLRPERLATYKDLNEYWVARQELPRVLVRPRPPE
jgi:DNA primase